jgi:hypothetical protein
MPQTIGTHRHRPVEDIAHGRTVEEVTLEGAQGYTQDILEFELQGGSEAAAVEISLLLSRSLSFGRSWAELVLVLEHDASDWDPCRPVNLRGVAREQWRTLRIELAKPVTGLRRARVVVNSEDAVHGSFYLGRPEPVAPEAARLMPLPDQASIEAAESLWPDPARRPAAGLIDALAALRLLVGGSEGLTMLVAASSAGPMPEEALLADRLAKVDRLVEDRGQPLGAGGAALALPALAVQGVEYDLVLLEASHRFDLNVCEFLQAMRVVKAGGLLIYHGALWPAGHRMLSFIDQNRGEQFRRLSLDGAETAIYRKILAHDPRPWDHFQHF